MRDAETAGAGVCAGERTPFRGWFSFHLAWVPEMKLKSPGLSDKQVYLLSHLTSLSRLRPK